MCVGFRPLYKSGVLIYELTKSRRVRGRLLHRSSFSTRKVSQFLLCRQISGLLILPVKDFLLFLQPALTDVY